VPIQPLSPRDLRESEPVWMLDLTWAGRVWRIATRPVHVLDDAGRRYSYDGGLVEPVDFSESLGRLDTDPGEASMSLAVDLGVDVADMIAKGHDLMMATASITMGTVTRQDTRLSIPTVQQVYRQRWPLLAGRFRKPAFGFPDRPAGHIEATVEDQPWRTGERDVAAGEVRLVTRDIQYITAGPAEITVTNTSVAGKVAPLVIGAPGLIGPDVAGSPVYPTGASPLTAHDGNTVLQPMIVSQGVVAASTVRVVISGNAYVGTVRQATFQGSTYSVVDEATLAPDGASEVDSDVYYAIWGNGGGVRSPYSAGALTNSAEVCAYMLARAGIDVDASRWLAIRGRGTFNVSTYINEPVKAYDWLDSTGILAGMGVSIRRGPDGFYPLLYDPRIRTDETRAHITEGEDWFAAGPVMVERESDDLVNALDVSYAYSAETEDPSAVLHFEPAADADVLPQRSHGSKTSVARYGRRLVNLDLPAVADRADAASVAARYIALRALPTYSVSYTAHWSWGWIQVGDALNITDTRAGWANVVAVVNERAWTGDG